MAGNRRPTALDTYQKVRDNIAFLREIIENLERTVSVAGKSALDPLRFDIASLAIFEKKRDKELQEEIKVLQAQLAFPQAIETAYLTATTELAKEYDKFITRYLFIKILFNVKDQIKTGSALFTEKISELNDLRQQLAKLESINVPVEETAALQKKITQLEVEIEDINESVIQFYKIILFILKLEANVIENIITHALSIATSLTAIESENYLLNKYFQERINIAYYNKILKINDDDVKQLDKELDEVNKAARELIPILQGLHLTLLELKQTITANNIDNYITKFFVDKNGMKVQGINTGINYRLLTTYREVLRIILSLGYDKKIIEIFGLMQLDAKCFFQIENNSLIFDRAIGDMMVEKMRTADIVAIINKVFIALNKENDSAALLLQKELNSRFTILEFQTKRKLPNQAFQLQCTDSNLLINKTAAPRMSLDIAVQQISELGSVYDIEVQLSDMQLKATNLQIKLFSHSYQVIYKMQQLFESALADTVRNIIGTQRPWGVPQGLFVAMKQPAWLEPMLEIISKPAHEFLVGAREIIKNYNVINKTWNTSYATEFFRLMLKSTEIHMCKSMEDFENINETLLAKMQDLHDRLEILKESQIDDFVIIQDSSVKEPLSKLAAIYQAIQDGTLGQVVEILDSENISVNQFIENESLLCIASRANRYDICLKLLDRYANPNIPNSRTGETALLIALKNDNIRIMKLLIERNADITPMVLETVKIKNNPEIKELIEKSHFTTLNPKR